ncbi:MAG: hypothetical protein D6677_10915 [Calditrichaeota bacterium]|nr:MAG: hypothetical protein D6677_10915 [Calditrichota bacterium]
MWRRRPRFGDKPHRGQSRYDLFRPDHICPENDWPDMVKYMQRYIFKYAYKIKVLHNYGTPGMEAKTQ